jgi:uncharacterized membrane protein YqjE
MKVLGHIAITITTGSVLYNYSHSLSAFLCFLIAGIFIDLDHYIDYVREHGLSLNLKSIYNTCMSPIYFKKITLILHSYELMILVWVIIIIFNLNVLWRYVAMGLTLHVLIDQITNPILPSAYFLWFRIVKNFETAKILEKGVDHANWNRQPYF